MVLAGRRARGGRADARHRLRARGWVKGEQQLWHERGALPMTDLHPRSSRVETGLPHRRRAVGRARAEQWCPQTGDVSRWWNLARVARGGESAAMQRKLGVPVLRRGRTAFVDEGRDRGVADQTRQGKRRRAVILPASGRRRWAPPALGPGSRRPVRIPCDVRALSACRRARAIRAACPRGARRQRRWLRCRRAAEARVASPRGRPRPRWCGGRPCADARVPGRIDCRRRWPIQGRRGERQHPASEARDRTRRRPHPRHAGTRRSSARPYAQPEGE